MIKAIGRDNKVRENNNAEPENTKKPFAVELIHVLAATKGTITKIFSDIDHVFVLKLLRMEEVLRQ